jgi:hypothetical protein
MDVERELKAAHWGCLKPGCAAVFDSTFDSTIRFDDSIRRFASIKVRVG